MYKKAKFSVPVPTSEEISNSKYCNQVIESFKTFQQSKNSNNQNNIYESFVKDLSTFAFKENNMNLIKYFTPSMINEVLIFLSKSAFNKENIILLFDILDKIVTITTNLSTTDFTIFIFSLMSNIQSVEILRAHIKMIETLFSDENFFSEFVEQQRVSEFFEITFINFRSVDFCFLFRHLICEISPKTLLPAVNLTKIISFLLTPIPKEIQIEYSIVLSKLIANNPSNRLFLNNNQSFFLFSNYIQSASSEIIINCFNDLVFTSPIDLQIFSNFILFYQKYPQHQNSIFHWIFEDVLNNHADMLYEINDIIPLSNWISLSTPVSDVIKAISILSKIDISLTSPFISPLFALLNKGDSKFEDYQSAIQIIENQLLLRQISLTFLANSLFLRTFVINIEIDLLGQLFEKIYTFSQLIYDIYIIPQSEGLRASIINKLIQMVGKFPMNAHFISIFLVVSNSKKNISDLMKTIIDSKNGDLCVTLGDSFVKSESVVKYFIHGNGIEWLDTIYKMKIVNLHQFAFLINSLTRNFFIKEVDNYINSLPRSHPIFSLKQEDLFSLCYGFDGAHNNYPLKILALFPLLNTFQKVDPYNAYMIGKYAFDRFTNFEDMPFFENVVNRYISNEAFQKIIKMDASKFELFCDSYYDHFPLFQVYEFLDENNFDVKFKAISFWFKFDHNVRKELKIPFFHADKLQLFLKESKLIANYEGTEYDAQVNPYKWNNVIVVVSAQKVSHYVDVYVNLNKAVFISSRLFTEMPNFEFTTYSSFMFIGPAIRVYQNEIVDKDIENIYKNGPSFLGHLNESLIISPFSKEYLSLGKNVYSVKYRGFPSHFLSKRKLNLLFDRMIDSNCKENEFNLLVLTCFKIYSLLRNSLRDFFRSILTVYSQVPHFVTSKLLLDTFEFFLKYLNKKEMIDNIIGHRQFWSNISIDLIINAILSKFKNFDFYSEKEKLEMFLSTELFSNTDNPILIENFFHCSKNGQTFIHELFTASHLSLKNQDKFTQCFLRSDSNMQNNEDSIDVADANNISIQCNHYNKGENLMNSYKFNSDLICTFQSINPTPFQKVFSNILKKIICSSKNLNYIPFDGVYSLFVTVSDNEMKASLYSILLNCEKNSPNSVQFDSVFVSNVPQLFNKKEVWTETFELMTNEGNEISKPSLLPVLFSLFWGAAVASVHSIASTGKTILNDNDDEISVVMMRIINFLSNESIMKTVSNDKNTLKFITSWFPFILCDSPPLKAKENEEHLLNEGYESQSIKLNGSAVSILSPFEFISMKWREVIKESGLPIETNKENYRKMQSFIVCSHVFNYFFNFMFSLPDSHFIEILGSFLSAPLVSSNKELSNCYVCAFIHSMLNIVAESYTLTINIDLISTFIHYMCFYGFIINRYFSTIISDLFLISSVIFVVYESSFKKYAPCLSILLLNLLSSSLKICIENQNDEINAHMIDVIYQVLLQQVNFLSKIAQESQNEIDLYLLFFKQSFNYCSKKETYNKVVTQFGNSLSITQNPQFQSLLANKDSENEIIDMKKWDDFIKSKIVPIINQNEINNLSFSYLRDCSKLYTTSFFNSIEKQRQISENLAKLFKKSKNFYNSKVDWSKALNEVHQIFNNSFYKNESLSKIEGNEILSPFMLPLRVPRHFICLPTKFANNKDSNDVIKFIDDLNLYKFSLNSLDSLIQVIKSNPSNVEFNEKTDFYQCEIKRLTETFQSILIVLNREILILPFCSLSNHTSSKTLQELNPPLKSTEVAQFVKEVVGGLWGHSILYTGRILIRIPIESILLTEQIGKNSIAIWSISSGNFIIDKYSGNVDKFINKFRKRLNFPYHSSLRIPTLEKLIIEWKNSRVSNSQLLLGVNLFNHRIFCDLQNFPKFPPNSTIFGVNEPINESLVKNLTQTETVGQIKFSNTIEESQEIVTRFISENFMLNIFFNDRIKLNPLFDDSLKFLNQKLNTDELKEGKIFDFDYKNNSNKLIFNLPKLSHRISDEEELVFLIIDKEKLSLSMRDFKNNKTICEEKSSLLSNAKNLYVSENRFFFSIDFSTDITCVYQIIYSNCSPISFKFIRDISFGMKQSTCISGVDFIGATSVNDRIFLWHFFPNTIHRIIKFESRIEFVKFDENSGTIWVVSSEVKETEKSDQFQCNIKFTLMSLNGDIFANTSLHLESNKRIKVSCFTVVPQPISVNIREAFCGFSDGSIYFVSVSPSNSDSPNEIKIIKLGSAHELPIKRIIFNPCTTFFVSVDSGSIAYFWSQKNDSKNLRFLDLSSFDACASCENEDVSDHCISCGRAFCKNCIKSGKKCNECLNE